MERCDKMKSEQEIEKTDYHKDLQPRDTIDIKVMLTKCRWFDLNAVRSPNASSGICCVE
jgi:hypothetical protein